VGKTCSLLTPIGPITTSQAAGVDLEDPQLLPRERAARVGCRCHGEQPIAEQLDSEDIGQ
jgi:hypothetical protein